MNVIPFQPTRDDAHRYRYPEVAEAQAASEDGQADHHDMALMLAELEQIDREEDKLLARQRDLNREIRDLTKRIATLTHEHQTNHERIELLDTRSDKIRHLLREYNRRGTTGHTHINHVLDEFQAGRGTKNRRQGA